MAKQRRGSTDLKLAKQYRDLLLYEVTGGNMGVKPEKEIGNSTVTFSEKKALLSEMIKIAELERKASETEVETSGFDLIKKDLANGRGKAGRGGNSWESIAAGINKSLADDAGTEADEASADA